MPALRNRRSDELPRNAMSGNERGRESTRTSLHRSLQEAGPYLTLGLELGFTMIAWSVIGYLLDRWLDTLPWLTMAGVVVGMTSVFIQVVRASRKLRASDSSRSRTSSGQPQDLPKSGSEEHNHSSNDGNSQH